MDKGQVLNYFWKTFDLDAYDVSSVPDNAEMPYITYESAIDGFGTEVALVANVWYRDTSWKDITQKVQNIFDSLSKGGKIIHYDDGAMWVRKADPFAQRVSDENDMVRRYVLNITVEFIEGR